MLRKLTLILMIVMISLSVFAWEINQQANFPVNIYDVQTIGSEVWAVASSGGVGHSTDNGEHFEFVETPAFNQSSDTYHTMYSVDFYDQNNGIIVGKDGFLMKTTDDGQNWTTNTQIADLFGTDDIESVVYHSDGKVWVCGYGGKIGYSSDFGETWVLQNSGTGNSLYSISMNENGRGFVASNNGSPDDATYLYTENFGEDWSIVHPDIDGEPTLFSVKQIGNDVIFTGDDGYIGISHDGGQTFTHHPLAGGNNIRMYDVVMNGNTGYAVGWKSTVLKTTDNWETFEVVDNNFGSYFSAIDLDNNQNLLAVGWHGTIVKSTDGANWIYKAVPSFDIYASSFAGNTLWIAGDKGLIKKSTDNGDSFENLFIPNTRSTFYTIYAKSDNEAFVTGRTSGNIYHTADGGQTWDTFTLPNVSSSKKFYKILFTSDQVGYIFGHADYCAKTTDGGATWNFITNNFAASEIIFSAKFFDDNTGFVGGAYGHLYYTTDGGNSWTQIFLNTEEIFSISFKDQNNGIITTGNGQIFYTHNGGLTVDDWSIATENSVEHILGSYYDENIALTCAYSSVDGNYGNDYAIMSSGNNGESWDEESFADLTFNPTRLTSVVSTGSKYIITGKNGVILSEDAVVAPDQPDLFISEYIEGSGSNKAIEIFNGTGADVDLSQYSVRLAGNGGDWGNTCNMTGILADGDVYVIANSGADEAILNVADTTSNITYFNGDDAVGLFKNDSPIDVFGVQGVDPGSAWDVAGITNATKNHTLVRKPNVSQGNLDWTTSAGTNADDSEWIVYPQDTFDYLGSHTYNGGNADYVATPLITPNGADFTDPINVEITCSTDNSTIYYTLDGSDPDENSSVYSAPINITETTTLKAIAFADEMLPSSIATAQFNHIEIIQVANIADLRNGSADGTVYQLTGEAVITFQQSYRGQKYIQDATAAILIDDNNGTITTQYNVGDGITNLTGTLSEYGNMVQFVPTQDPGTASSTGNEITPEVVTLPELTANFMNYQAELIKVENVNFENNGDIFANGQIYNILDSNQNLFPFRTTFYNVNYIGGVIPSGNVNIVGICNSRSTGNYLTARDSSDFSTNSVEELITVTSPNGGENWQQNSSHNITWTSANFDGQVKIELLTNGRNLRTRSVTLAESLENSGTWTWDIPADFAIGDAYTIKVSDSGDGNPYDVSDADFSITEESNSNAEDLFISEYIEGSSNNKAIEIFNGTGADVDLTEYSVRLAGNGGDWGNTCNLTGILANGDVFVIANPTAGEAILNVADTTSNVTYFNGDDAIGLFKNDSPIDIFGVQGVDPGSAWDVAGITNATKNHTLVRKPNVSKGNLDWTASAGTNTDDSEWIVYPIDTFDYIGSHTFTGGGEDYVSTPVINPNGGNFTDPIDVEISCSTENSTIYYTLDGSDPDENSSVYSAPINITDTTTLKAIAYADGMEPSLIASAQFNHIVIVQVSNIAALRAGATDGTVYQLTGEAVITFQQSYRGQKYIQDASAAILIDDNNGVITTQYNVGDGITNLTGTLNEYGNMIQFIPVQDPGTASSTGNEITPEVVTLTELNSNFADYQSELIKVENVTFENGGDIFATGQVYNVNDSAQNSFGFRTSFYSANYIGGTIPNYNLDIVGICNSRNDGNYFTARDSADFALNAPDETILVTSPNGGETWQQNSSHNITWTSANFDGQVKIEILTNGRNLRTRSVVLADSLENSGSWTWNIPADFAIGDAYTIKVSDSEDGNPFDVSDADFAIIEPVEPPVVIINEIMYNPASSLGNDADYEYLEIYNAGNNEANLTGWSIQNACTYSFEDGTTIPVNGYLVIAINPQMIMDHYQIENVVGPFNGALNNSGETIEIHNADNEIVDEVTYSDSDPWPTSADGQGPSLELISPDLDNSLAESWQASFVADGTPGAENTVIPDAVPHTIYEIQFTENEDGSSNLVGTRVQTSGVITALFANGFFIQNGEGAWNGVMVNGSVENAQLGQEITLDATVSEANGQTSLNDIANVVLGDVTDLPAPAEVSTNTVATDESYEGVLVKVTNAVCTNDSLGYGEWEIDDNSGACRVDDMGYVFAPQTGTHYDVIGVVNYSYQNFKIEPRDADDISVNTENENNENQINSVKLVGNYPNPFNPTTTIVFTTKTEGNVNITIYNVLGQKICTLVNKSFNKGMHKVIWNGKDSYGRNAGSGVYFYSMRNGKYTSTKKMILLK